MVNLESNEVLNRFGKRPETPQVNVAGNLEEPSTE